MSYQPCGQQGVRVGGNARRQPRSNAQRLRLQQGRRSRQSKLALTVQARAPGEATVPLGQGLQATRGSLAKSDVIVAVMLTTSFFWHGG